MLGLGLSLQKGISAFNAGRALVSSYIRRVTDAGGVLQNTACDAAAINELNQDRLLEPASWVLVPDGIEEDIVFAQKPTSGLGDLTFTRASDATYTDSTGVVRRSPYNLLTFSEDLSNVAWQKLFASISSNVTTAPNGLLTADKLVEDTTNASHTIFQTISISASTNYNYSVYLKAAERFRFRIRFTGFSGAQDNSVDLNLGTAFAGTLTSVGNGWFRLTWPINSGTGAGSPLVAITLQDASGNSTYLGNGTSGAFIWGAQLVEGTSALDYFPTTNRQDVPRIDFRNADGTLSSCGRLLLEPQRTNSIRNSSMVGAVAGSPGTLPTNWGLFGAGLTRTIVGIGTESGLTYIDVRFNGTATSGEVSFNLEVANSISATAAQTWTLTSYAKLISGTINGARLSWDEFNSSLGYVATKIGSVTVGSTLTRVSYTNTTSATCAFVQPQFRASVTSGATYDFTIRIAAPQMELGAYATTFIPTTTAAVTRLADTASKTGVSSLIGQTEGTIFIEINKTQNGYNYYSISDGTNNNWIFVGLDADSPNLIRAYVRTVTGITADIKSGVIANGTVKMAIAYKLNDVVLYVNGTQIGTDTSAAMPTGLSGIYLTGNVSSTTVTNAVNQAALFPTRLTNAQLSQLTTL
jgi:hypothetical protein